MVKNPPANAGDSGLIPVRKIPRGGHSLPGACQYACLESPKDEDSGRLLSIGSQRVRHD